MQMVYIADVAQNGIVADKTVPGLLTYVQQSNDKDGLGDVEADVVADNDYTSHPSTMVVVNDEKRTTNTHGPSNDYQ